MVVTVPPIRQYYGYRPSEMVPTTFPGMWLYPSFEDLNVKISVLLCLQSLTDHGDQYMGMRMTNEVATKEYSRVYQRTNEDVHVSKIPSISAGVLCNQSFCQGPGFLNLSAPALESSLFKTTQNSTRSTSQLQSPNTSSGYRNCISIISYI